MQEETEWDTIKAESNARKHRKKNKEGLSFDEAKEVFDDPFYLERFDTVNTTPDEERYQVIGRVRSQLVVFVVYTPRNGTKRIISARPALTRERNVYYENIRNHYLGMRG